MIKVSDLYQLYHYPSDTVTKLPYLLVAGDAVESAPSVIYDFDASVDYLEGSYFYENQEVYYVHANLSAAAFDAAKVTMLTMKASFVKTHTAGDAVEADWARVDSNGTMRICVDGDPSGDIDGAAWVDADSAVKLFTATVYKEELADISETESLITSFIKLGGNLHAGVATFLVSVLGESISTTGYQSGTRTTSTPSAAMYGTYNYASAYIGYAATSNAAIGSVDLNAVNQGHADSEVVTNTDASNVTMGSISSNTFSDIDGVTRTITEFVEERDTTPELPPTQGFTFEVEGFLDNEEMFFTFHHLKIITHDGRTVLLYRSDSNSLQGTIGSAWFWSSANPNNNLGAFEAGLWDTDNTFAIAGNTTFTVEIHLGIEE